MLVSHRALWRAQGAHGEPGPLVLKRLFYSFPLPSTCHQEKCFSHDNEFLSSHKQLVWSEIKVKYRLKGNISAIFNFGRLHLSFSNLQNGIGALHPIQCIRAALGSSLDTALFWPVWVIYSLPLTSSMFLFLKNVYSAGLQSAYSGSNEMCVCVCVWSLSY